MSGLSRPSAVLFSCKFAVFRKIVDLPRVLRVFSDMCVLYGFLRCFIVFNFVRVFTVFSAC